jgi:hypothetical protein
MNHTPQHVLWWRRHPISSAPPGSLQNEAGELQCRMLIRLRDLALAPLPSLISKASALALRSREIPQVMPRGKRALAVPKVLQVAHVAPREESGRPMRAAFNDGLGLRPDRPPMLRHMLARIEAQKLNRQRRVCGGKTMCGIF